LLNQEIFEVRVVNGNRGVDEVGVEIDEIIERWRNIGSMRNVTHS
jgi:hypothetical protein